jgi:hypothetical protein
MGIRWVSVRYPLGIRWVSVGYIEEILCASMAVMAAPRRFHQVPALFWQCGQAHYSKRIVFFQNSLPRGNSTPSQAHAGEGGHAGREDLEISAS